MSKEIIDLLEKARESNSLVFEALRRRTSAYISDAECTNSFIDQTIDLLKQQPTAGDFTKRLRSFVKLYEKEIPRRAEITFLKEACDIIDRAEAINKIKDKRIAEFEAMVKAGGECCDILQERIDILSEGKAKKEGERE